MRLDLVFQRIQLHLQISTTEFFGLAFAYEPLPEKVTTFVNGKNNGQIKQIQSHHKQGFGVKPVEFGLIVIHKIVEKK